MSLKVVIAIPSEDQVYTDFALSLVTMVSMTLQKHSSIIILSIVNEKSCSIAQSRCKLVEMAKQQKADAILFIDDDMVFPADLLIRLAKHNKDIVGCEAITHRIPFKSNCVKISGQSTDGSDHGLEEVYSVGTGIMLIRMPVFDKLTIPYFDQIYDKEKNRWQGEDVGFCIKAGLAGIKIYVDHDLSKSVDHLGVMPFMIQDLKGYQDADK